MTDHVARKDSAFVRPDSLLLIINPRIDYLSNSTWEIAEENTGTAFGTLEDEDVLGECSDSDSAAGSEV